MRLNDPDLVAANRCGEVAPAQRAHLTCWSVVRSVRLAGGVSLLRVTLLVVVTPVVFAASFWPILVPGLPDLLVVPLSFVTLVGLLGIVFTAPSLRTWLVLRDDLRRGAVRQERGHVGSDGETVTVRVPSGRLATLGDRLTLGVGEYDLWYLERSRLLLSAARVDDGRGAAPSLHDLPATVRTEPLTQQERRTQQRGRTRAALAIGVVSAVALAVGLWLYGGNGWAALTSYGGRGAAELTVAATVSACVSVALQVQRIRRADQDLADGRVLVVEGVLRDKDPTAFAAGRYVIDVGGEALRVDHASFACLVVGSRYRFRAAAATRDVLDYQRLYPGTGA